MTNAAIQRRYEIVDFAHVAPVECPCGSARRGFMNVEDFAGSVHLTDIACDARTHYHRRLTETYFILECGPEAQMELDDERVPLKPSMCILIRPGVRHRAIGKMRVLILSLPKFDPADEWFD